MGTRKSPFTPEIYEAWDQLVLLNGEQLTIDERFEGWKNLHAMCWQDGKWVVGIMDAGLSGSLGVTLALMQGRFRDAQRLSRELLSHADIRSDLVTYSNAIEREISASILVGEIDDVSSKALDLIDRREFGHSTRTFTLSIIGSLADIMRELGVDKELDPKIRQFAMDLVSRFSGFKKDAKMIETFAKNSELQDWVGSLYRRNQQR